MTRALNLRVADPAVCAQRNILLAAQVPDMTLARLEPGERYVSWAVTLDSRPSNVFIRLQALIDFWLEDDTLPAAQIDLDIAQAFVRDAFRAHGLPCPSPSLVWVEPEGFARPEDFGAPLFLLRGGPFDVYMSRIPDDFHRPPPSLPYLPVDLRWSLGDVRLPLSALEGLMTGDVIRLPAAPGRLLAGDTPIFLIHVLGDSLMLDAMSRAHSFDDYDDGADAEPVAQTLDTTQLPVVLSFVLARQPLTVAEVSALQPGVTLPLDQHTPYVNIMAGPVAVARGELVRLGDGLGVEVLEIVQRGSAPEHCPHD